VIKFFSKKKQKTIEKKLTPFLGIFFPFGELKLTGRAKPFFYSFFCFFGRTQKLLVELRPTSLKVHRQLKMFDRIDIYLKKKKINNFFDFFFLEKLFFRKLFSQNVF
jgi:hypothetical protein